MDENIKLHEKDRKKIKALQSDWDVKTSESEIDMVVYGAGRYTRL